MSKKKLSISSKFFLGMSSIAIGFILILLVTTSMIVYYFFSQSAAQSSMAQLDYVSAQLRYYLTSTENYAKTLMIDSEIQENLKNYSSTISSPIKIDHSTIKNHINSVIQSTNFIHSVTLYAPDKTMLVTTETFPTGDLSEIPTDFKQIWRTKSKISNVNRDVSVFTLSMVKPFYSLADGSLIGYIEIAIPESKISDIYKENSTPNNHLFMIDAHGMVRSSDGGRALGSVYEDMDSFVNSSGHHSANSHIVFYKNFAPLDWYVVNEISFSSYFQPLHSLLIMTILIGSLCILVCLLVSHRLSTTITSPLYRLIAHTQTIKNGSWTPITEDYQDRDIGLLFTEFNTMIVAQEDLKNNLLESEKLKNQISLDLLQQQVNPHFLYNTLDNICSLAEIGEKDTLIDIVMSLSTFYRQGLNNGKNIISLQDELELTKAYLHIMMIRYYNKFEFHINCPPSLLEYSCIKLLLQPLVENSIYHGIKELTTKGLLEITVFDLEPNLQIIVQDNGIGFTPAAYAKIWSEDTHFGVKNIHQRIQLYYGPSYGLVMELVSTGGCKTTITIPKRRI